ncbi:MAG: hypothetical protein NTY19_24290 [Planctomycetota bacterium]|nr:hypothetical protein [Planctomycetota bacterium]
MVYVDDAWLGTAPEVTPVNSDPAELIFGYNAFATLQSAIDQVAPGGGVTLYGGIYADPVDLNKELSSIWITANSLIPDQATVDITGMLTASVRQAVTFASDNGRVSLVPLDGQPQRWNFRATGTAGDDNFIFAAGSATHSVTLNGNRYTVDAALVETVELLGQDGHDVATLLGSAGDDQVMLKPGYGTLTGDRYAVVAENVETIRVDSLSGGWDTAFFFDSSDDDVFLATTESARLTGLGFDNEVRHFDRSYAYASNGGLDTAKLYDSSGDDTFTADGQANGARFQGAGFDFYAEGFAKTYAYATGGGLDTAKLFDSAGDDTFTADGQANGARFQGTGFDLYAEGFKKTYAYATSGGVDTAKLVDSAGDDMFTADVQANGARFLGTGFDLYAEGFEKTYAYATGGGIDMAKLVDSVGNDTFTADGQANGARFQGTGFDLYAEGFEKTYAYATDGGVDTAKLYDSAGDDTLTADGQANGTRFQGTGFDIYAEGFAKTYAYATGGGIDTAKLYDSAGADTFQGRSDWYRMTMPESLAEGQGFDRVSASSRAGGIDMLDVEAVDWVLASSGSWIPARLDLTLTLPEFVEGQAYRNVTIATFTDSDPRGTPSDYQAVIDWGDGFQTTASAAEHTILRTDDGFSVLGSHTYLEAATAVGLTFAVQVKSLRNAVAPATAQQVLGGGPFEASYQRGTHTLTNSVNVAHWSKLVGAGGVYDPAQSGAITSLEYGYDFAVFSGPSPSSQVGVGLLIRQGLALYVANYTFVGQDGWRRLGSAVTASDFRLLDGAGPAAPDFSIRGAPLEIGYLTANSARGVWQTLTWGLAGFETTINGTRYADAEFRDEDWTHLILCSNDFGGAHDLEQTTVFVADPPLTLTLPPLRFVAGQAYDQVVVGIFTDANPNEALRHYSAVIDWGDGFVTTASADAGTIVRDGDIFDILGSHTYRASAERLTFRATVQDSGSQNNPAEIHQVLSGGPADEPYQGGTLTFTSGDLVAQLSKRAGVYEPGISGAITSLSYAYDFQVFSGAQQQDEIGVGLLVKQSSTYYLADYRFVGQNGWHHLDASLQAADFRVIVGDGPATPDFGATAAPLEIGYFTAHTCLGWQQMTWGLANFQVEINGRVSTDTTFQNTDWTQLVLWSDDLGAAQDTRSANIAVAEAA